MLHSVIDFLSHFDEHINDPMLSIENLLQLLQENIGGKRLLSDRQFADVKLEIERRAQAILKPGDEITVENQHRWRGTNC